MIELLKHQQQVCEAQRAACLKTCNETLAAFYKCRLIEIQAEIEALQRKDDCHAIHAPGI